jgi:DNA-binding FrmR family transcriptional regulator
MHSALAGLLAGGAGVPGPSPDALVGAIPPYVIVWKERQRMAHVAREKTKLLNRLRRIRGQVEAIERAVEADSECARVLQQATACRGALEGFIGEVIEDHIREHMVDPTLPKDDPRARAAEDLVEIVHSYLT